MNDTIQEVDERDDSQQKPPAEVELAVLGEDVVLDPGQVALLRVVRVHVL